MLYVLQSAFGTFYRPECGEEHEGKYDNVQHPMPWT